MYLLPFRRNQTRWHHFLQALQIWKNTSTSVWGMAPAPSPRSKPSGSGLPRSWKDWALCCTETDGCRWLAPHWKTPNSCHTGYQTLTHCSVDWAGWGSCFPPHSHAGTSLHAERVSLPLGTYLCIGTTRRDRSKATGMNHQMGSQKTAAFTQLFSSPFCKCFWPVLKAYVPGWRPSGQFRASFGLSKER